MYTYENPWNHAYERDERLRQLLIDDMAILYNKITEYSDSHGENMNPDEIQAVAVEAIRDLGPQVMPRWAEWQTFCTAMDKAEEERRGVTEEDCEERRLARNKLKRQRRGAITDLLREYGLTPGIERLLREKGATPKAAWILKDLPRTPQVEKLLLDLRLIKLPEVAMTPEQKAAMEVERVVKEQRLESERERKIREHKTVVITITQFADVLKVPVETLLVHLDQAGIKVSGSKDTISEDAKLKFLTHLRRGEGALVSDSTPRRITLRRAAKRSTDNET